MGRPTKQAIDFFSLDVQFDDKTELYLLETESDGLAVLITLFQLTYGNEGYYIRYNEDLLLLIKKRISRDTDIIDKCIKALIRRRIFDPVRFKKHKILTSRGIQERYFSAARKKKQVIVKDAYLMIKSVSDYKNLVTDDGNDVVAVRNATKEKEKEKEEEKEETFLFQSVKMSKDEHNKLIEKYGAISAQKMIEKLNNYKLSSGKKYRSDYRAILTWVVDSVKPEQSGVVRKI